mgnify:CR=1 FL=1
MFVKSVFLTLLFLVGVLSSHSQVTYPYPVRYFSLAVENQNVKMAYMDVPASSSGSAAKTVLLLHGKNFNGYYWKDVIAGLKAKGYRVIVPDQLGWGKSDKPKRTFDSQPNKTRRSSKK